MSPFVLLAAVALAMPVPPKAERGRAGAACRADESGPAARLTVDGLKDREGALFVELYPANDEDFLAADKALIAAGKPFRRIEVAPPPKGTVELCIRAPAPGTYALTILHDRDGNGKFGFMRDGVGFPNNPPLGRSKPSASAAAIRIGPGLADTTVVMNYRRGFRFAPLARER